MVYVVVCSDDLFTLRLQVRQNYIRRRLLITYKALERLTQSEFNLDRLEAAAASASASSTGPSGSQHKTLLTVPGGPAAAVSAAAEASTPSSLSPTSTVLRVVRPRLLTNRNLPLTIRDVERERGKPLSKYDRNMMIFNWLHTLDDGEFEPGQP